MLIPRQRRSRRRRHRRYFVLGMAVAIGVLLVLIFGPNLRHRFLTWRYQRTLAEQAAKAEDKPVVTPTSALHGSFRSNPGNPAAWRLAADMLENLGDRAALEVREQIIQLEPTRFEDRLAWARTALRFRDLPVATAALESLPARARDSADYKRLAAAAAFVAGRNAEADELFAQTIVAGSEPARVKLERQFFRLRYGNFSQASDARQELETASRSPEFRAEILRELIADDLRRNEPASARTRGDSLVNLPGVTFADRLLWAELIVLLTPERIISLQAELAPFIEGNPEHATLYLGWLANYGQLTAAAKWIDAQPPALRQHPGVFAARTGLALAQQNTEQASAFLRQGAWGSIEPQAVQLALSARLLQSRERPELRREVWASALTATEQQLSGLQVMRRLALLWDWREEYETTLFHIARRFPQETWTHQLLAEQFLRHKKTNELKAVYALWHQAAPGDARVEMTWLQLELLTAPASTDNRITARVREIYETNRNDVLFALTYALSRWQLGVNDDALTALDKLPANERRTPARAFYYALYLATARRTEEARTYLELAAETNLLSEERTLLNRARSLADARPRS